MNSNSSSNRTATTLLSERVGDLPQNLYGLLADQGFTTTAREIIAHSEIPEEYRVAVLNEFVYILLLYAPVTELSQRLQQNYGIAAATAESVARSLTAHLPEEVQTDLLLADRDMKESLAATAPTTEATAGIPAAPAPVTPLRTMPEDMEKVHGYGSLAKAQAQKNGQEPVHQSAQDSVLGKPHLTSTPQYEADKSESN